MLIQYMANCCCKGKEMRSRSDRDREVKLLWAHTVTLIHTNINFRVTESVAMTNIVTLTYFSHIKDLKCHFKRD